MGMGSAATVGGRESEVSNAGVASEVRGAWADTRVVDDSNSVRIAKVSRLSSKCQCVLVSVGGMTRLLKFSSQVMHPFILFDHLFRIL